MGASGIYALRFPVEAGNPKPLKDIAEAASRIAQQTKVSSAEFKIFQDELTRSIAKGGKMSSVLAQIAREFQNSTPALKTFTAALREESVAWESTAAKAEKSAARVAAAAKRSADERARAAARAAAAELKAASDAVKKQEADSLRFSGGLGRIGGRLGGSVIGRVAGIPGAGFIGSQGATVFGGTFAAIAGITAAISLVDSAFEKLAARQKDIQELAQALGVSEGAASRFADVAGLAGTKAETLASAGEHIAQIFSQASPASRELVESLSQLGVSATDAGGKLRPTSEILNDTLTSLSNIPDPTLRSAAAFKTLGTEAKNLGDLINKYPALLNILGGSNPLAQKQDAAAIDAMRFSQNFGVGDFLTGIAGGALTSAYTPLFQQQLRFERAGGIKNPGYHAPFDVSIGGPAGDLGRFVTNQDTREGLGRNVSEAKKAYDAALTQAEAASKNLDLSPEGANYNKASVNSAKQKYLDALAKQKSFEESQRSGESLAKRRQQLREELSQEGAKPGSLARFQFKYRDLRNGSAADQAAYYSGFQDLFQTINSRPIKDSELSGFSADQATRSAGLRSNASLARNFFDDFPNLSGITSAGLPPASASIATQGLQSQLRFRSRLARIGNQSPEAVAKAEAQDTIQTLQQEQAEREKELEAADKSTRKMGDIADLRQKYLDKITDAENDYTLKLKEISEERKRSFGDSFSSLVISAQNGGARGVQGFLRGTGEGIESKILSNLAANFIFPKIQIPQARNANSTIGKLLAGTPFGAKEDPLKLSTDLNTKSTDMNTAALLANYKAITGKSITIPGGGGGISVPGLSTFGSDTNGITGRGGLSSIFRSFGGGAGGSNGGVENGGIGGDSLPSDSGGSGLSLGKIATIGGAALGAYKGIDDLLKGGAKRKIGGVGELLGSAAGIAAMIPGGQAVALGLGIASGVSGLVSALLPDPKQQRINQISKTMFTSQYLAPQAIKLSTGSNGGYSDVDQFGNVRTSSLSPYPIVSNPYLDVPRRTDVPGHTISPFGGYSNQTGAQVNVTVHAMDSKSFLDHSDDIAGAVQNALKSNYHPLIKTVRDQL